MRLEFAAHGRLHSSVTSFCLAVALSNPLSSSRVGARFTKICCRVLFGGGDCVSLSAMEHQERSSRPLGIWWSSIMLPSPSNLLQNPTVIQIIPPCPSFPLPPSMIKTPQSIPGKDSVENRGNADSGCDASPARHLLRFVSHPLHLAEEQPISRVLAVRAEGVASYAHAAADGRRCLERG